jgi:hypothetical protein
MIKIDIKKFIENARGAFGHIKDISDIECLCLVISQLNHVGYERNSAWSENHKLRKQIIQLQNKLGLSVN